MESTLHNWYSTGEVAAAFSVGPDAETCCDGQFVVLPATVLCFITISANTDESHVSSPSRVVWRPQRLDCEPANEATWLPDKVRDVWERSQYKVRKLRNHHLFLRSPADEQYFYAGEAHLGSYGSTPNSSGWGFAAHFSLSKKLPRETWIKFGGYPGWLIEINHRCHRVTSGDIPTFVRLVKEVSAQEFSHLCMTRYEEDSLTVHTNARRGWLMYLRFPADNGVYTRDLDYHGPTEAEEVFECVCGIGLEFAPSQTLPLALAVRAAVEFFQTGQLPSCVHWDLDGSTVPCNNKRVPANEPTTGEDEDIPF